MTKKILIIDDEPDILKVIVYRLKKLNYEVITAVSGEGAIDLIKKEMPNLIFLDLRLPKINGDEICLNIKADSSISGIPVILITASSNNIAEITKNCKADDYCLKPFTPEELIAKTEKYIK